MRCPVEAIFKEIWRAFGMCLSGTTEGGNRRWKMRLRLAGRRKKKLERIFSLREKYIYREWLLLLGVCGSGFGRIWGFVISNLEQGTFSKCTQYANSWNSVMGLSNIQWIWYNFYPNKFNIKKLFRFAFTFFLICSRIVWYSKYDKTSIKFMQCYIKSKGKLKKTAVRVGKIISDTLSLSNYYKYYQNLLKFI